MFAWKSKSNNPRNLVEPNFSQLAETTKISKKDVLSIYRRFSSICDDNGLLYPKNALHIEEFIINPLVIWCIYYESSLLVPQAIDFDHFISILSKFSPQSDATSKLEYFFTTLGCQNENDLITKESFLRFSSFIFSQTSSVQFCETYGNSIWNSIEDNTHANGISRNIFLKYMSRFDIWSLLSISLGK